MQNEKTDSEADCRACPVGIRLAVVVLAVLGLGAVGAAPVQARIHVDTDATGANDGSSWTDAYPNLQDALSGATSSDSIWIADGTYYPDEGADVPAGTRDTSFVVTGAQDSLKIYGGFDGTESSISSRDVSANTVTLSGDIGVGGDASDNSYHVLRFNGANSPITMSTRLDGVIVTGGNADGSGPDANDDSGAGLYCNGETGECSPTLKNIAFASNSAAFGGAAIYNEGDNGVSSPAIENATFTNNTANGDGGALYNSATAGGTSRPTIRNSVFENNSSSSRGGALYNVGDGSGTQSGRIGVSSVGVSGSSTLTMAPAQDFQPGEPVTVSVLADSIADTDGLRLDSTETVAFTATAAAGSSTLASVSTSLPNVSESAVDWGDFDNDGDLDLVVAGDSSGTTNRKTSIYENDVENNNGFSRVGAGLTSVDNADVAWGDYNGDGNLDVIVTGYTGSGAMTELYGGDGTGTFTSPIGTGLVEVRNSSVDWADYNGDGHLDLVLSGQSGSGDTTQVYRNEGGGSFAPADAGLVDVEKGEVDWGDYDNDGRPDLAVAGTDGSFRYANVYRNEGGGTFTKVIGLTGVENAAAQWGDYDNDGLLDLAISGKDGSDSRSTTIYRNEGGGNFSSLSAGLTGLQDGSVDWGDYDGDGRLDLAVMGDSTGGGDLATKIYRNDGGGSFSALGAGLTGARQGDLAWADYDGNGVLDLVTSGLSGSATTTLYRQTSNLRVTDTSPTRNATGVDTSLTGISVALNKTPDPDSITTGAVRVVGSQTGPIPEADDSVGVTNSTLTYEPARDFQPGEAIAVSLLADSVVAADGTRLSTTHVTRFTAGNASGPTTFPTSASISPYEANDVLSADFDGDGNLDVGLSVSTDSILWYQNQGSGSFTEDTVTTNATNAKALAVADVDDDGTPDLIDNDLDWYANDGTGSFTKNSTTNASSSYDIAAGDLNGDGHPDVLGSSAGDNAVIWYPNTGSGFADADTLATDVTLSGQVATADVDDDGDLDAVVANSNTGTIAWYENTDGAGSFAGATVISSGVDARALALFDAEGDGDLDVFGSAPSWYENNGSGSFSAQSLSTNDDPSLDLTAADLNADNTADIVGAAFYDAAVVEYRNDGTGTFARDAVTDDARDVTETAVVDLDGDGDLDVISASDSGLNPGTTWHPNTTIAPQVVTDAASSITDSSFVAEGRVNPGGLGTTVTVQYSQNGSFDSDSSVTANSSLTGDDTTAVSATVTDLEPITTYEYRFKATNSKGSGTGAGQTVTTDPAGPTITTDLASAVDTSQATLNATLTPNGDTTTVSAEFGRTSGTTLSTLPPDTVANSLDSDTTLSAPTADTLRPSTEYRFRFDAQSDFGADTSDFAAFTTHNVAPTATNDTAATDEDTDLTVDVLANDGDVGEAGLGGALDSSSVTVVDTAEIGQVTDVDGTTGTLTYTLDPDSSGTDSLRYAVADDSSATDTALVAITVREVNDPPVADGNSATVAEDDTVTVDVLADDTDPDGKTDSSTVAVQAPPAIGTIDTVDAASGATTYVPTPDSNGTDSFTYTVADDSGAVSNGATVAVDIAPRNDAPIAAADTFSAPDNKTLNAPAPGVLENDTDIDEDDIPTVTTVVDSPAHGTVTLQSNGAVDYTPDPDYIGTDAFIYEVEDDSNATATDTTVIQVQEATLATLTDTSRAGSRHVGQPDSAVTLSVRNDGEIPLTGLQSAIDGPNAGDFTVTADDDPDSLTVGATQSYDIVFAPSGTGVREATLDVTATEEDTTRTVALRGRGVEIDVRGGIATRNAETDVALSIAGGFAPTAEQRLFFRKGGTSTYRDTVLTVGADDSLRTSIPDSLVTTRGVDYYVTLSDSNSTITVPPGGKPQTAAARPAHLPVSFEELSPPDTTEDDLFQAETYRMVS
ncbi:MAG: hypothetical protein BRD55_04325, partial [Bacteroidetes bacterium SW_9_63_38]